MGSGKHINAPGHHLLLRLPAAKADLPEDRGDSAERGSHGRVLSPEGNPSDGMLDGADAFATNALAS